MKMATPMPKNSAPYIIRKFSFLSSIPMAKDTKNTASMHPTIIPAMVIVLNQNSFLFARYNCNGAYTKKLKQGSRTHKAVKTISGLDLYIFRLFIFSSQFSHINSPFCGLMIFL